MFPTFHITTMKSCHSSCDQLLSRRAYWEAPMLRIGYSNHFHPSQLKERTGERRGPLEVVLNSWREDIPSLHITTIFTIKAKEGRPKIITDKGFLCICQNHSPSLPHITQSESGPLSWEIGWEPGPSECLMLPGCGGGGRREDRTERGTPALPPFSMANIPLLVYMNWENIKEHAWTSAIFVVLHQSAIL